MKVIKELIQYLFQSDKLSRKELDWFLKNDHLDYSEWKEIGLLKQKRHSEKHQFNPLKTEESIPDSKGRRGGEKFQSNLASLIYDLNKEVLGKQDHWEKDLKPLLKFAGGLLRKNFTDSKTAIEGLLNFIQSQSVEANEKSFSSLFQSEAELKEDLEFLLNYPKPKKCLEDRKYRHLKEKMLSEKGLKLPSRFIPIERRPGFLWLKDFLFLQTVLKPVSAAFQNKENVKAVFGTKNFLFHFQENGELDFLEAADTVIFFGFIMKKKDRIYYEEKLQELRILIAPSEIYSGKTNPIEVRIKRIENGQRLKTELPQEMEIHRIHFKKDSEVFFYPNGNLYEVNLFYAILTVAPSCRFLFLVPAIFLSMHLPPFYLQCPVLSFAACFQQLVLQLLLHY